MSFFRRVSAKASPGGRGREGLSRFSLCTGESGVEWSPRMWSHIVHPGAVTTEPCLCLFGAFFPSPLELWSGLKRTCPAEVEISPTLWLFPISGRGVKIKARKRLQLTWCPHMGTECYPPVKLLNKLLWPWVEAFDLCSLSLQLQLKWVGWALPEHLIVALSMWCHVSCSDNRAGSVWPKLSILCIDVVPPLSHTPNQVKPSWIALNLI